MHETGPAELVLYDAAGRRVDVLVRQTLAAGRHEVTWNADRRSLASGVYFAVLRAGEVVSRQKVVLLK